MVDLAVSGDNPVLHVRGADKLWALKSSLEIPSAHIAEIRADPAIAQGWWHGLRMPGTNIPGVLTAGTFYQDGRRVFWGRRPTSRRGIGKGRLAAPKRLTMTT
jgi:hypothetical protein